MAWPFGGHPKLSRLLEYLKEAGCTWKVVVRTSKAGKTYRALEISSPSGGTAVLVDPDMDEHMSPSMVTYFQRRLAIKTPFASMPEQTQDPEYEQE